MPVSDAFWSTWRAYCDAVGVPMGRGIAALIAWELRLVVEEDLEQLQKLLREREAELAEWEEQHSPAARRAWPSASGPSTTRTSASAPEPSSARFSPPQHRSMDRSK